MKHIALILILMTCKGWTQINGNKQIETRTFPVENVKHIIINLYAEVTIDASSAESLTITTDANLFDLIEKKVVNDTLHLDQKKWISPSNKPIIKIGAPQLIGIIQGTHDLTRIKNINSQLFTIQAEVGKIILQGKTEQLNVISEQSTIDATNLIAKKVIATINGWGVCKVNVTDRLEAEVSNGGSIYYLEKPLKLIAHNKEDGKIGSLTEKDKIVNEEAKYITIKLKNNSWNRHHLQVIGPKQDGTNFGYGFAMMPWSTKEETWTVGTKIYKVNELGLKKLLVTLTAENENNLVKLFNE